MQDKTLNKTYFYSGCTNHRVLWLRYCLESLEKTNTKSILIQIMWLSISLKYFTLWLIIIFMLQPHSLIFLISNHHSLLSYIKHHCNTFWMRIFSLVKRNEQSIKNTKYCRNFQMTCYRVLLKRTKIWNELSYLNINRYDHFMYNFIIIINCYTLSNSHNYVRYDSFDHINNYYIKASV